MFTILSTVLLMLNGMPFPTRAADSSLNAVGDPKLYSFTLKTIDGQERSLASYRGKVLLIVNVASRCGYTPQYAGLEKMYEQYREKGFEILGFPANDFLRQEPGSDSQIQQFCSTTYGVTFQLFSKISVKGSEQHPLYHYLTEESPRPGPVRWNFQKYLVNRKGEVVARFSPGTEPMEEEVVKNVEQLLAEPF